MVLTIEEPPPASFRAFLQDFPLFPASAMMHHVIGLEDDRIEIGPNSN
jgi:hypothetical protein